VTLGGEVVLSRSQNVVRGTRLVIDLSSGESTIDTAPAKAVALPSGGGWANEAAESEPPENRGRASAVFYPQNIRAGTNGKPSREVPDSKTPDGWTATSPPESFGGSGN
jgi:hypothetical protein